MTSGGPRDESWHNALCKEYDDKVANYVARQLEPWQRDHLLQEVVQDVRRIAWEKIEDIPDEPLAWLLAVARNCLRSEGRREKRYWNRFVPHETVPDPGVPSHEQQVVDRAEWRALTKCLSGSDRQILELTIYFGLSDREIAQVLAPRFMKITFSENNVAKRRERALKKVRKHLPAKLVDQPHRGEKS